MKSKISSKRNQFWNWNLKLQLRVLLHTTHGSSTSELSLIHFEKMQNSVRSTRVQKEYVKIVALVIITVVLWHFGEWKLSDYVLGWGRSAPSWHGWTKCNTWKHWSKLQLQSVAAMPIYTLCLDQVCTICWKTGVTLIRHCLIYEFQF